MLKEEEIESQDAYHALLHHSLLAEKQLRDRRRKCETQLQSWLQKYDVEMSAKQEELDDLTKMYEDEVEQIENLKIKLDNQNKEFEPLMAEREAEYHQEMTNKLNAFIIEHAARVIQVAWRTTLSNRAEKKKLNRLRKKMEAEREAAERKAEIEAKKAAAAAAKQAKKEKAEAKAAAKAAKLEAKNQPKEGKPQEGGETPAEGQ
ncbi:dynein regulatory complex protein 10-like [Leguminivora glycinivorella]|uniref:dynein regulatory complex protein 10-like n=1 Tax=Leguminivora glycinivorella TaxID=1035111 RepID=UPI0020106648|nr:dynein regulatory complex protein 10-like [Leguminivora glycinivorella]